MRTLGELVDRLVTVNLKLWLCQDEVQQAARIGAGLSAETVRKLADLNFERNRLMSEVDECFAAGLSSGTTKVEHRHKF